MNIIKPYLKLLKATRVFLLTLITLILLDMFVLGAWLKNFFVRANTSDYSPFSTDGQSNWVLVLVCVIALIIIIYIIGKLTSFVEDKKEDEPEEEEEDETTKNPVTKFNQ
jgi:hypothetical protein